MSNNNFFKYIFAIVVVFLVGYTVYIIFQNKEDVTEYNVDQTSTLNNIQTDLRLAISGFDTINPLLTNNRNVQEISKVIYDSLVTLDGNYKLKNCLAEEIAQTDEVTYIIKMRKSDIKVLSVTVVVLKSQRHQFVESVWDISSLQLRYLISGTSRVSQAEWDLSLIYHQEYLKKYYILQLFCCIFTCKLF